ncbi:M24 family metallopeptidase [Actinomadura adrarensis]|uniref:M24 family metallopeptidase n=1 Tax=Actinomadura adrarensis TaxID=1819600 RepID=A0ABW3CSS6_9ACTN
MSLLTSPMPSHAPGSTAERDLRWSRISAAMEADGYDALVFAANDYRGHKGSLRYLADYNLCHKYGYAVMFRGEAPILVLPQQQENDRRPATEWVSDYRFPYNLGAGLVETLRAKGGDLRVGIVGLRQIMKVEDYLALTEGLPGCTFSDADPLFNRVRAVKSPAEMAATRESAYILDRCFDRLLEIAHPGMTEQQIAAEMFRVGSLHGGQDPLFLTMYAERRGDTARPTFGQPEDRVLGVNDVFTFSFEIVGPSGYWTELSRMVTFAAPSAANVQISQAVTAGIQAAEQAMVPGVEMADVQKSVIAAVEAAGATSAYWSGHGMGLDVLEQPWIGLDVVQDESKDRDVTAASDGMLLAVHPALWNADAEVMGYMADSFVIENGAAQRLSKHPLQLYRIC